MDYKTFKIHQLNHAFRQGMITAEELSEEVEKIENLLVY